MNTLKRLQEDLVRRESSESGLSNSDRILVDQRLNAIFVNVVATSEGQKFIKVRFKSFV